MSTPFQNRLVGTIIVAAVVVIFLPDLLDGEKKSNQTDFEAIPQAEDFSGKLTNKPFPEERLIRQEALKTSNEPAMDEVIETHTPPIDEPAIIEEKVVVTPASDTRNTTTVVKKETKPLPEKAVASEAWVIHLGSFKNKDNVAQLLKKLKAQGYIAFTKPIQTKKGTLTKVIIGPELIKSAMTKKLPALRKLTGIQGKVATFEVNE
ncbi:SPOR domain-containing protein [Colwellia sp. E2M01]|uniref:SPOR domain-containing protein n=1 Tax=Colwellia sp. E2M01 TaxID=2841561 RepID=UPI001C080DC8|nr:SPOR domain-containing protein [Colwellia sp. E2M01]MBU2872299.1 SPOR domain-containing protein [Colwellia sp. E2M01]